MLHSLTSKSDLSAAGSAKEIAYTWGKADASLLDAALSSADFSGKLVTIHYEELLVSLIAAVEKFLRFADAEPALKSRLDEAAALHYTNLPIPERR